MWGGVEGEKLEGILEGGGVWGWGWGVWKEVGDGLRESDWRFDVNKIDGDGGWDVGGLKKEGCFVGKEWGEVGWKVG